MRILIIIPNKLRRFIMKLVDKDYLKNKLNKRKGECKRCGQCCKGCNFLDKNTNLCIKYENRPFYCHKDFPIDKLDQKIIGVKNCGYNF